MTLAGTRSPMRPVDLTYPVKVELVVGFLGHEFVAEELGRLAGGMGYEGLILG